MQQGTVTLGLMDDGHTWSACFGFSLRDLFLHDAYAEARLLRGGELRSISGTGGIADGRNTIAKSFLEKRDGEWLFLVDTDMGFTKDTVDRLVASADKHDRPVVGGLCFALRGAPKQVTPLNGLRYRIVPTLYTYQELEDESGFAPMMDYPRDSVVQVHGTGAACLLIHRSVLETVGAKFGTWFETIHDGDRHYSEDLSFCMRLGLAGIPLHVDTSVKTTHDKGGLFLDEETYDLWRSAGSNQGSE